MNTTLLRMALPAVVLLSAVALMTGCNQSYAHRIVSAGENEVTVSDKEGIEQQTHEVALDAKITLDGQPAELNQLGVGDAVDVKIEEREGKEVATEIKAKAKVTIEAEQQAVESEDSSVDLPEEQPIRPLDNMPLPFSDAAPQPDVAPPDTLPEANLPETDSPAIDPEGGAPSLDEESATDDQAAEEKYEGKISSVSSVDNQFVVTADNGDEHTFTVNDDTKYTLDGEEATFGDLVVGHMVNVTAEPDGESFIAKSVDATTE